MGIPCRRLSEDELWQRIRNRAIDRFTTASVGFVGAVENVGYLRMI